VTRRAMHNRTLAALTVLGASLSLSAEGLALPIFNAEGANGEDCKWTDAFDGAYDQRNDNFSGEAITVFVENDIASEFASCGANVLSQQQIERQIQDAMEVWNREANGRVLVWGGTLNVTSEAAACGLVQPQMPGGSAQPPTNTPAVIVHGHTDPGGGTSAGNIADCPGVVRIQLKLTKDGDNSASAFDACASNGADDPKNKDWDNRRYNLASITGAMVHEFGHTLGLGHRHQTQSTSDPNSGQAVMSYENTSNDGDDRDNVNNASDLHLWQWDKDCVDDDGVFVSSGGASVVVNERTVEPVYVNYPVSGGHGPIQAPQESLIKAARSGGSGRASNNSTRYALWFGSHLLTSSGIGTGFGHSFPNTFTVPSGLDVSVERASVSPVFFSMLEETVASERHRINALAVPTSPGVVNDPPLQVAVTSDGWFDDSEAIATRLYFTGDYSLVQSHLPMMAAYDPVTGQTIFVRVNTTRVDTASSTDDTNGIFLHTRQTASPILEVLEGTGTSLASAVNAPSYPNPPPPPKIFTYDRKTATQPGVACADGSFDPPGPGNYNCILVWKDLGSPDGHILYVHFKVDPNASDPADRFEFKKNATILMYGATEAATPGDLTVAYFGDKFRVAYKTYGSGFQQNQIKVILGTPQDYTFYTGTNDVGTAGYVVDAPTWHYRATNANKATTLSWTVDATL
jgi:hypothetical protein